MIKLRIAKTGILLCGIIPFIIGLAPAESKEDSIYIATDGTRSLFTMEERTNEFLSSNIPDGIKDHKIQWEHIEQPSRPNANQKSIKIQGGYIVTSTLYMKNTIRIITVTNKESPTLQQILFYQHTPWSGQHIEVDKSNGGVKMAIDREDKHFVVISIVEGTLKVTTLKSTTRRGIQRR